MKKIKGILVNFRDFFLCKCYIISRFSAFTFLRSDYIIKTTHQQNCDFSLDTFSWRDDIEKFSKNTNFEKLEILDFIDSDFESFVTFKATLFQNKKDISFPEFLNFFIIESRIPNSWYLQKLKSSNYGVPKLKLIKFHHVCS